MPTGYTAKIKDGISFDEFIMSCARNFGALIMMRDEPSDAPIPERFEPSDYHEKKISEIEHSIEEITFLSEADAAEAAKADWEENEQRRLSRLLEIREQKKQYLNMLESVERWNPPTEDHVGLKDFMRDQIEKSIDFDCDESYYQQPEEKVSGEVWRADRLEKLHNDLGYHLKGHEEEVARTESRNEWLLALRQSLSA